MSRTLSKPSTAHAGKTTYTWDDKRIKPVVQTWNLQYQEQIGSRSDIVKRPPGGFRLPTPYSMNVSEYFALRVAATFRWPTTYYIPGVGNVNTYQTIVVSGAQRGPSSVSEVNIPTYGTNDQSRLVAKALSDVKNQKVNVAMVVAEAQQTVNLLATSLGRLGRAYKAAKSLDWVTAARILGVPKTLSKNHKSAKSGWLELQYGWKPLLSDIHGGIQILTDPATYEGFIVTGKASIRKESSFSFKTRHVLADGLTYADVDYITRWQSEQKVRLDYRVDSTALLSAMSLGLTNPAIIAWELVPFSFLVDWAIPIGSVLDALDATLGLTFLGGSKTTYHQGIQVGDSSTFGSSSYGPGYGSATALGRKKTMTRSVFTSSPLPFFYVQNPLSVSHAANAYALIRSK